MRTKHRTFLAVVGLLASFLTAAPAAAQGETAHSETAAAAPTTSPAARHRTWLPAGSTYTCESGFACATVRYGQGFYLFKFYAYGTYALQNWYGDGYVWNAQTGGASVRVLGSGGGQLLCEARSPWVRYVDWNPAWYIRLSPGGC
jgi:hypothetical protein